MITTTKEKMEYCNWCGTKLSDDYEEILDESEDENANYVEEYRKVCKECLDGEMS